MKIFIKDRKYYAPRVEMLDVEAENCFALSYGEDGAAGSSFGTEEDDLYNYGIY